MPESGLYKGKHYSAYYGEVAQLKRDNLLDQAEQLLLELLDAVEEEAHESGRAVAPLITGS